METKCEECGKKFKNKHGLNVHIYRMHKRNSTKIKKPKRNPFKMHICPYCGGKYALLENE